MATEIDGLSLRLGADFSDLNRAFAGLDSRVADLGKDLDAQLGGAFETTEKRMGDALERAARRGELSFASLRNAGVKAASDILTGFLDLGFQGIGLGSTGAFGKNAIATALDGLFGRANGGPVSAGVPYLVGERGPELFLPRTPGRIAPNRAGQAGGTQVTMNFMARAMNRRFAAAPVRWRRPWRGRCNAVNAIYEGRY